eukprot:gene20521-24632_t
MQFIYAVIFFFAHYAYFAAFGCFKLLLSFWRLCLSLQSSMTNRVPVEDRKRVVIVGGGFSGSVAAQKLENDFQVTLIDTKDYFEFTPSILRTIVEPQHIRSIQVLHSHYLKHTNVVQKEVIGVKAREVVCDDRVVPYDYLIINSGSSYNSPFKESSVVASARANTLRENYYHIRKLKKILIIGGGIVGVELAAEIVSHFAGKEVTIIHSQSKLMNRFPKAAIRYAEKYLTDHGVRIVHNERVIAHKGNLFITDQGSELIADQAFLCTGIAPNSDFIKASYPDAISEFGYIKTNEFLQMAGSTLLRNVFVAGDVLNVREEKLAQLAENTADIVVNNIYALEYRTESKMKAYKSFSKPVLISLGKYCSIFVYKDWVFTGLLPALLKEAVEWKTMGVQMIANQILDPLSFSMIFSAYSHLFTVTSLMTATTGGNLVAVETIHRHLVKHQVAIPVTRLVSEAFMCGHMQVLVYMVENMNVKLLDPMKAHQDDEMILPSFYGRQRDTGTVPLSRLRSRHLQGYTYLRSKLTNTQLQAFFGKDPLYVLYLQSIPLFTEKFGKSLKDCAKVTDIIDALVNDRLDLWTREPKMASKKKRDVQFLDFVEHVLKACAKTTKEKDKITKKRNKARSLTSNLTPEKEVLLTLLEYSVDITPTEYTCIIGWNDLELTPYTLKSFGFDAICQHGSLEQVQAADQLLGPNHTAATENAMDSSNIEVLRYLQANCPKTLECDQECIRHEDNIDVVRFHVETQQHGWMIYSLSEVLKNNRLAIARYLHAQGDRCFNLDIDSFSYSIPVESTEMMEFLISINIPHNSINFKIHKGSDLAALQLYVNMSGADTKALSRLLENSCGLGLFKHVEYLLSVLPAKTPLHTVHLDIAFAHKHMDIVHLLLAKRSERFLEQSWINAAISGDIGLFEFVRSNSAGDMTLEAVEAAYSNGNLSLAKHITTKYPTLFKAANIDLTPCLENDHADVLDYHLTTHKSTKITAGLMEHATTHDAICCLQVILTHIPAKHTLASVTAYFNLLAILGGIENHPTHHHTFKINEKKRAAPDSITPPVIRPKITRPRK